LKNEVSKFIELYKDDPISFIENCLGAELDPWQREFFEIIPTTRKVSIAAGHGVGKSTALCFLCLHTLLFNLPCKGVISAPSTAQLHSALWADLKMWIEHLPEVLRDTIEYTQDIIRLKEAPNESFIRAAVARIDQPDALQGVHAQSGIVLLIVDEAAGVHEKIFESAYGSLSQENAKMILIGNPTRNSGYFYETFHRVKDEWTNFQVSCLDSPRVSQSYINEMRNLYGEDSAMYKVRVLGEFADEEEAGFISPSIVRSAINRDIEVSPSSPIIWGLDVARQGRDKSALCKRQGGVITEKVKTWRKLDLMSLAGEIMNEFENTEPDKQCAELLIDSIGLGAGLFDRIAEIGIIPCRGINVSESSALVNECGNLRAELWYKAREFFEKKTCSIPDDPELIKELSAPRYHFDSRGRYLIESKDEMRKRGERSPDHADAFCLTFATNPAILSGGERISWNQPLVRDIRGIQ
jgi:phage terminase large subunit